MQLDFPFLWKPKSQRVRCLAIGSVAVPIHFVRKPRARRYILRVGKDGSVLVTIPRGGTVSFGHEFALKNLQWITQQRAKRQAQAADRSPWVDGTKLLFKGQEFALAKKAADGAELIEFAGQSIPLAGPVSDLRPAVEAFLWRLAGKELPSLVWQLAQSHQFAPRRVAVRNQRSRWGSCSVKGTISLNWRLIQAPRSVQDYLVLHELAHLREMNHSSRFWKLVEQICPEYEVAEAWLDRHAHLLRA